MTLGIITGSGTYTLPGFEGGSPEPVATIWGDAFVSRGTFAGAEVLHVPLHRALRMLVVHVHVVEALDRAGLCVLDHRVVGAAQVPEAALARRLNASFAKLENLLLRREAGQRVTRHVDQLAVLRVPHLRDLQPHRAEPLVVLA